eukprot:scaffold15456_cov45-Attheya_sp.AAC.2
MKFGDSSRCNPYPSCCILWNLYRGFVPIKENFLFDGGIVDEMKQFLDSKTFHFESPHEYESLDPIPTMISTSRIRQGPSLDMILEEAESLRPVSVSHAEPIYTIDPLLSSPFVEMLLT